MSCGNEVEKWSSGEQFQKITMVIAGSLGAGDAHLLKTTGEGHVHVPLSQPNLATIVAEAEKENMAKGRGAKDQAALNSFYSKFFPSIMRTELTSANGRVEVTARKVGTADAKEKERRALERQARNQQNFLPPNAVVLQHEKTSARSKKSSTKAGAKRKNRYKDLLLKCAC